ncbi:hypothetical protein F2Q70_00021032 [Brassica cretica]|uniref:Uncharacterized protein n=1 Tax=Brassica cretica TaxID=69181 RepID=A0A8S9GP39_BRACR|nr:hypothetical protein F2Q70_00021032 [Brassica cretica]
MNSEEILEPLESRLRILHNSEDISDKLVVLGISSEVCLLGIPSENSEGFPRKEEIPRNYFRRLVSSERLRNNVDSKKGLNFSYSGGSSSPNDDSDQDETRASSIQSRRREPRGQDEGRLVDPTRRTGELDCTFGAFGPTRPFGELDGALDLDD